tara:strand:+ start:441 stop:599 length:159 start_codon:yes stop_codon:yes gene_type:complete
MNKNLKKLATTVLSLTEYEQKQLMSIMLFNMLNELPNKEAKKIYNSITKQLS